MSDIEAPKEKKSLSIAKPRRLELNKTVGSGQVRQSFSHGRSKTVQVEVKKKRTIARAVSAPVEAPPPLPVVEAPPPRGAGRNRGCGGRARLDQGPRDAADPYR